MNGKLLALLGVLLVCATAVFGYGFLTMPAGAVADVETVREAAARAELTAGLQAKNALLEAELAKAREEARRATADLSQIALLKVRLAEAKEETQRVLVDKTKTVAAIDALIQQGGLKSGDDRLLEDQNVAYRFQVDELQRKTLVLTGNVTALANSLAEARKERDDLRVENQRLKQEAAGTLVPDKVKTSGVVTNATREVLVVISLGSDDGVRRGMTFEVLRDDKPIGRIEVLHASPHAAVGKELPTFKQADIATDDRVVNLAD